jgi:type II pantothenate kinase
VGSGVSIIKILNDHEYERISGSSLGGAMFLGIANLLTNENDFQKLLEMSNQGDSNKVLMGN